MKRQSGSRLFAVLIVAGSFVGLSSEGANLPTPDAQVGKKPGAQKGDNIYNSTGAGQTVGIRKKGRGKAKFFFTAQNDDPTSMDTLTTKSPRGNRKLKAKYIQISPPGGNVTAEITGAGHSSGMLASDEKVQYKAIVKTKPKFRDRRAKKTYGIVVSAMNGGIPDVARAKVKKKP